MKNTLSISLVAAAMALTGCSLGSSSANLGNVGSDQQPNVVDPNASAVPTDPIPNQPDPNQPDPNQPPAVVNHCDFGKSYTGFGGTVLEVGRVDNDLGIDTARMKPYSALVTEYPRVLGTTPSLLTGMNATFSDPVARWYVEPQASAISLYTAYRIAFQGCLTYTATPTQYASMPSNTTAATECGNFAMKFWSRAMTQAETDACVQVAMVDTVKETSAQRRWAYTCAAVLSSAGFMSY